MSTTVTRQQSGDAVALRMAARRADGTLLCTSRAPPEGAAATLRCRFPAVAADVPAQRCASCGGVVCTPPSDSGGGAAQPYECFAGDALLAEGVYDPTAAPADAPAPPPPKRGGMRPFAIMCAARRACGAAVGTAR